MLTEKHQFQQIHLEDIHSGIWFYGFPFLRAVQRIDIPLQLILGFVPLELKRPLWTVPAF